MIFGLKIQCVGIGYIEMNNDTLKLIEKHLWFISSSIIEESNKPSISDKSYDLLKEANLQCIKVMTLIQDAIGYN